MSTKPISDELIKLANDVVSLKGITKEIEFGKDIPDKIYFKLCG